MPSRTFLTIACLVIAASLPGVRVEAQPTYCLTPTAMPQTPAPPSPPPICEPKTCEKCTKSPCYVATGIYVTDATDLQIRTAGTIPLVASRLYDSSRGADGPLGTGWSSGLMPHLYYATYLFSAPSTYSHEADVVMPDGVIYRFAMSGGAFTPPSGRFDTLVRNADQTYSLTLQHSRTVYRFAADGSVSSLTDDFGNVITWTYDSSGRVQRVADSAGSGRYIDLTWGPDGRVSTLTDNSGRQVKYYYDAIDGTLTGVAEPTISADASLRSTKYTYDAGRFGKVLTRISDRWDRVISALEWNPDGKLKSYTDGFYDVTNPSASTGEKYSYDYQPAATTKANSLGSFSYPYDSNGLVNGQNYVNGLPVVGGFNSLSHYEYDSSGRITKVTSPSPEPPGGSGTVVWWYTYDTTWPNNISTIIPKDQYGNLKTNWAGWKYDYHGASDAAPGSLSLVWRIRSDTTTMDAVARYIYDSHGHLLQYTDVDAHTTEYSYNAAGDLVSVTDPDGHATQFTYDTLGRVLSNTDPNGHAITMTYDALDRLLTVTRPRPSSTATYDTVTTFSYDNYDSGTGLAFTNTTDPNGRVTKQGFDAIGHVTQSIDANGNLTKFVYQYDLLKTIRDANGNETSYGYDTTRALNRTTFPDGAFETYQMYTDGSLYRRTDRRGQATVYAYDDLGRLASIVYEGVNGSQGYQVPVGQFYSYDGQKLISVQDYEPAETTSHGYAYDSAWRVVTDSGTSRKVTYTYEGSVAGGSMLSSYTIAPPEGTTTGTTQTVSLTHDAYGNMVGQTWSWIPNAPFAFSYTPTGQYHSMTFPNGQQRSFTYDNQDRLTNITNTSPTGSTIASFDYAYDYDWQTSTYSMRGQRTSVAVTAPGAANIVSGLTKYSYDAAYQLVRADYADNTYEAWTYDAIGNRLSKRIRNWPNPIPSTYYINAAGGNSQRLHNDSFADFTYDAAGNVTSAGSDTYTWDHAGRLTSYGGKTYGYEMFGRSSVTTGGSTTRYIGMNGRTVGERNSTTGVATDYIFGPGIDEPLAKRTANGSISYFGVDGLGSVVVSTDTAGTVLSSSGYSPWGELSALPAPELFGYTGREVGGPSWYYRARYYEASNGRFLSEDPLGYYGSFSLYGYVEANPIAYSDPSGLARSNTQRCASLLRRIQNIRDQIAKRMRDVENNPQDQPFCTFGPQRESVLGHMLIIANLELQLAARIQEYMRECGGGPPAVPVFLPRMMTSGGGSQEASRVVTGIIAVPLGTATDFAGVFIHPCRLNPNLPGCGGSHDCPSCPF